ncbi:hypothetical protein RI065_00435 [Mycoplasmatota bacterium zrk1]
MSFKKLLLLCSIMIVIFTVFLLPYSYSDGLRFEFGYPLAFITLYDLPPIQSNEILLMRMQINIIALIIDVFLVYSVLNFISFLLRRIKTNGREEI